MTYAISATGLAFIQKCEGFRAAPAPLPDGSWLVGHGHVRAGAPGELVSRSEAAALLAQDLAAVERLVNETITQPLTQSQVDALVSFAFSIGAEAFAGSQVQRRVNCGDLIAAACAMDAWRKAEIAGQSVVVGALVRRRAAEKALFLKDYRIEPAALLRAKLDHAASILGAPAPTLRPQRNIGVRITEILTSEPATEALLLSKPAPVELCDGAEGEVTTAHARPVARPLDGAREAPAFAWAGRRSAGAFLSLSFETFGLVVLLAVGLTLISAGASILFGSEGGLVDLVGAAALLAPGVAAALMCAFAWRRGPDATA